MKPTNLLVAIIGFAFSFTSFDANADTTLLGYNTSGDVYQIDPANGTLTLKASEQIHSFSLGAIVRRKSVLYYVAAPAGATENALFAADTKTGTITHVDLDRSDSDDEVVALFFEGKKLFGLFYNSNAGDLGIYQINIATGVTTLKRNLSTLNLEPVSGAIARIGRFSYFLAKPSGDSSRRQLVRFNPKSPIVKVSEIETKGASPSPVLCDRIKRIQLSLNFFCLASTASTQVDAYRLQSSGKATYLSTLSGIERLAGGHTMGTPDGRSFYAFVYASGETNNQRLVKLSAKGQVKSNSTINTLIVGARFGVEDSEAE